MPEQSYPRKCSSCRKPAVYRDTIHYQSSIKHDGKTYPIDIAELSVAKCRECGEQVFDNTSDDQIQAALRVQLNVLMPAAIREKRESLKLTQKQMSEKLGVAVASLSRWETGAMIQSQSTDRLLRMFFKHPDDSVWSGAEEPEEKSVITPLELCEKLRDEMRSFAFATVNPLEESLLGQLLLRPSELKSVSRLIRSMDFSNEMCQHIYEAMLSCFNDHHETLHDHFVTCVRDQLVKADPKSVAFLTTFVDHVRPADNAMDIASMLRNRAMIHEKFGHIDETMAHD